MEMLRVIPLAPPGSLPAAAGQPHICRALEGQERVGHRSRASDPPGTGHMVGAGSGWTAPSGLCLGSPSGPPHEADGRPGPRRTEQRPSHAGRFVGVGGCGVYRVPVESDPFVSYAQNGEDVVLFRALGAVEGGRYVDVGANDPIFESVTYAFYLRGWSGITIDPCLLYT